MHETFPKPVRAPKVRRPMKRGCRVNPIGPVGKRRLAANKVRKAEDPPWMNVCEVGPVLRNRGITFVRCQGTADELTWAHARKVHRRSKKAKVGTPEHEETIARSCQIHHYEYLDKLNPDITCDIIMEAIRRRASQW